ncbi:peptidoglycan-binding domain-containing protein, partial [Klebsiella pneumoniae]
MALQQQLNRRGFDSGEPDGIVGPATRSAIRAFQQARGLVSDGHPGQEVLDALGVV